MAQFVVYENKVQLSGFGSAPEWSQRWLSYGSEESKQELEAIDNDSRSAFATLFQSFLRGLVGGWVRNEVMVMTPELAEIQTVALRGPGDVFLVMAALTFAKVATERFGNPTFTGPDDPAFREYAAKVGAAQEEILKNPIRPEYCAIANWLGGEGGLPQAMRWTFLSFVDYYAITTANAIGWNANTYLEPEKITDSKMGQAVNVAEAMIKLKTLSPWSALWCQERAFGKALNKEADAQRNIEQVQVKVMQKVAETTDQAAKTMGDAVDALNDALKNLGGFFKGLGEWIVPIALGIGGLWLLFTFAPAIVRKTGETQAALSEVRARKKR